MNAPARQFDRIDASLSAMMRPLDALRRVVLVALGPFGQRMVRDRELRVAIVAAMAIVVAAFFTAYAPFYLLLLGPVLLGVPHLIGDLRYMLVRPGFHRRWPVWIAIALPGGFAIAGKGAWAGATSLALCALVARGPLWRRAVVTLFAGVFALCTVASRTVTEMVVAHAHNILAIVLWAMWRKRTTRAHWIPTAAFFAVLIVMLTGAFEPMLKSMGAMLRVPDRVEIMSTLSTYAPYASQPWALRLTLMFIFAQSVHYAVWTRLVPEDDRGRDTPRTFGATLRALRADLGLVLFLAGGAVALGITVWSTWNLADARLSYLRLSTGHAYIELAAAMLLWMERGRHLGTLPVHERAKTFTLHFPRRFALALQRVRA